MSKATEVIIKDEIHENANYRVNVVRIPDMFFDTYAVINKGTGVIEQIHPNIYNVCKIADQFDRWIEVGPDDEDEVGYLLDQFNGPSGKAN